MKQVISMFSSSQGTIRVEESNHTWGEPFRTRVCPAVVAGETPFTMTYHLSRFPAVTFAGDLYGAFLVGFMVPVAIIVVSLLMFMEQLPLAVHRNELDTHVDHPRRDYTGTIGVWGCVCRNHGNCSSGSAAGLK
jgi:hypothetical protein